MIDKFFKKRFAIPCADGGQTKPFIAGKHLGEDFGWVVTKNCDILAAQDGVVVDKFYSSTCGYSIVLQHDYSDGTHCWTGYIHLAQPAIPNIKESVRMNDKIGVRGTTGTSSGVHLHLYLSDCTTKPYTWETMKACCTIDPNPLLYRSKAVKYNKLGISGGYSTKQFIEDLPQPIKYPTPVERNDKIKQVNVLIEYLFMRDAPNGNAYNEYCAKGIYNIQAEEVNGNYCWYLIDTIDGNEFWIASGGTRTEDLLPVLSQEEILQNKVNELQSLYDALDESYESLKEEYRILDAEKAEIAEKNTSLASNIKTLNSTLTAREKEIDKLNSKIVTAIKALS